MSHFAEYLPGRHGVRDATLVLRAALPGDVDGIARVARTRGDRLVGLEDRLSAWVRDDERVVVVARRAAETDRGVGDEVVGWSSASRMSGHDDAPDGWYVSSLTVDPAWRRRGAGDRLLAAVVAATSVRSPVLRSIVNATNLPSLDLHAAHAFVEEARGSSFAGITFLGGEGVLLRRQRDDHAAPPAPDVRDMLGA